VSGTLSGSCGMTAFGTRGVESLGSATRELVTN
jgi:hypothetical protein